MDLVQVEQVDQRDIQKKGGPYVKFPSSYVVCGLLGECGKVFDVTFGEGRFYKTCRDNIELLIGNDIKRWDWIVKPDLFFQFNVFYLYSLLSKGKFALPVRDIDIIVVDPPRWNVKARYNKREMYNSLIGNPLLIIQYAGKIAKVLNTKLLVHYRDIVQIEGFKPIRGVRFTWVARYLNSENKNNSYYVIYEVQ